VNMAKLRRKTLIRILEAAAVGLAALDLVLYLAVSRPLAVAARDEQQTFSETRLQVKQTQARIAQFQKELAALPQTRHELDQFLQDHVPQRRKAYSRAAGLVHKFTQDAGVELTRVAYRPEGRPSEPLEQLGISVTVQGPFEGLQRFTHSLETSSDLLIVRGAIFQPGETGGLALRLLADLYVNP
jgi:Tfp pilus assembly protein PilO